MRLRRVVLALLLLVMLVTGIGQATASPAAAPPRDVVVRDPGLCLWLRQVDLGLCY